MPSLRIISALAVAVIAARPARSFLAPMSSSHAPTSRRGSGSGHASAGQRAAATGGAAAATTGFSHAPRRSRSIHSSSSSSSSSRRSRSFGTGVGSSRGSRHSSRGGGGGDGLTVMMAKKKGGAGGKKKRAVGKKGVAAAAAAAPGKNPSAAKGGGGVAVAEADASSAAEGVKIQNRAGGEQPVAVPPTKAKTSPLEAAAAAASSAVNGAAAAADADVTAGGWASKGFGAPAPKPKPASQKGVNNGPKPMSPAARSPPPPKQPGFDALAGGIPNAGQTDHERLLTEVDFSEPDTESMDDIRLNSPAGQQNGEEMSPADMLKYLRDNSLTIDLETMTPVAMPTDNARKMEAFFPHPTATAVQQYSLGAQPKPTQFADAIIALLPEDEPWNGKKIRPLPELKEFLVANRHHAGKRGLNVITSMMLKALSEGNLERAKYLKGAAICMTKAENAITAPFRQAVMFAENRLAPCMGSTVCEEYAGDDGADAAATWVVLKACVAEWELRLREIRGEEIGLHDMFRTMPNPTEGLDEERTAAITGSVQAMGLSFSNNDKLMKSLPPVLRFMDVALGLNSTTEVRRYALQDFCPKEGMSPEELRLRVRSFVTGLDQLPSKSYHQLQIATADVYECLVQGTADEYCLYLNNWQAETSEGDDNLSFKSYRLDTGEVWRNRLREIITSPVPQRENKDDYEALFKEILPKKLWNFAASDKTDSYELPFVYLKEGWWDALKFLDEDRMAEERAMEAEMEASAMKDPAMTEGMEGQGEEMDDIFTDFMKEQEREMALYEFSDDDFADDGDDSDIRDGPGPGMEELDLGFDGGPGVLDFGN